MRLVIPQVFISAFGSLFMYGGIFLFLWFRLFQAGAYNHQLFQLRRAADGRLVPTSPIAVIPATPAAGGDAGDASARFPNIEHELSKTSAFEKEGDVAPVTATLDVKGAGWARRPSATTSLGAVSATSKSEPRPPKIKQRIKDPNAVERNRRLDRAALMMLLFPAAYIISILPLAIFRLARVTKKPWTYNFDVQAGCGFLFALGGCFNAILYVITRKIFRSSKDSEHSQSNNCVWCITCSITMSVEAERTLLLNIAKAQVHHHLDHRRATRSVAAILAAFVSPSRKRAMATDIRRKGTVEGLMRRSASCPFPAG